MILIDSTHLRNNKNSKPIYTRYPDAAHFLHN